MGKTKHITLGSPEAEQVQKEKAKLQREQKKAQKGAVKKTKVPEVMSAEQPEVAKAPKKEAKKQKATPKRRGKKYREAALKIDKKKSYSVKNAVALLKQIAYARFNSSVELHLQVIDMSVKGEVILPHGTGKEVRVAVFNPEIEKKLQANVIDFDVLLALPEDMKTLVKYARMLGPKGLMPSPKKGTVTANIDATRQKFTGGNVYIKTEPKFPLIHQVVGKSSFSQEQLEENILAFLTGVSKKNITGNVYIKTSMSPTVRLTLEEFI